MIPLLIFTGFVVVIFGFAAFIIVTTELKIRKLRKEGNYLI